MTVKEAILEYSDKATEAILDDLVQAALAKDLNLKIESSWG